MACVVVATDPEDYGDSRAFLVEACERGRVRPPDVWHLTAVASLEKDSQSYSWMPDGMRKDVRHGLDAFVTLVEESTRNKVGGRPGLTPFLDEGMNPFHLLGVPSAGREGRADDLYAAYRRHSDRLYAVFSLVESVVGLLEEYQALTSELAEEKGENLEQERFGILLATLLSHLREGAQHSWREFAEGRLSIFRCRLCGKRTLHLQRYHQTSGNRFCSKVCDSRWSVLPTERRDQTRQQAEQVPETSAGSNGLSIGKLRPRLADHYESIRAVRASRAAMR